MNDLKKDKEIGIIVTYPENGKKHSKSSGIAGYTKNLLLGMSSEERQNIVVFSDIKTKNKQFVDENILVNECWHRGNLLFFIEILHNIKKFKKLKVIHIQHEFNLFGGGLSTLLYLILLRNIHKIGIKIIVTYHGVVSQKQIDKRFVNINQINIPKNIFKIIIAFIYKYSAKFIETTIVHEQIFKDILINEYGFNSSKVAVVPHGVEDLKLDSKKESRKKLHINNDKHVILFFGFLAGYKGLDLLIDAFSNLNTKDYLLIIAGGKPARTKDNFAYKQWYNKLCQKIKQSKNICRVDFVPDDEISLYYSVSDIVVFPYLKMLSASGPMSFAISYNKPFIASSVFKKVLDKELLFDLDEYSLSNKIQDYFNSDSKLDSKIKFAIRDMRDYRLWKNIANKTYQVYKEKI